MTPGLHRSAADIAMRAGRVMNYGDGLYGGVFVAGMYTAAFLQADPVKVVQAGLASIPAKSPYALLIADLLRWYKQNPEDWRKTWQLLEDKWDRNDPCPEGALRPFNIDAKINGAYIALGLLYGKKDFGQTIEIATWAGQDSDCNPASAGGVLGVMLGYHAIPDEYKGGIPALADKKFEYTDFSFDAIVDSTEKRTLALIRKTGGKVDAGKVTIQTQPPEPPKLEVWNYGTVAERVPAKRQAMGVCRRLAFGHGQGHDPDGQRGRPILRSGGKADVYLDGRLDRTVDVASDAGSGRSSESVWHIFGLKSGPHHVRVVVPGEPYGNYAGTTVGITDLVVFRQGPLPGVFVLGGVDLAVPVERPRQPGKTPGSGGLVRNRLA
jgi:hypothetical protein